jgi:hypothetical protein
MRALLVALVGACGCAPANYVYNFELTDPGARNLTKPGERDTIEDAEVKSEILVDPTSFQAILLDLTNKTDLPLDVRWREIAIVGPDHIQAPIRPDGPVGPVEPQAKLVIRLVPFALPAQGSAAEAYDHSSFELVVPMVVRGTPREYRYHLRARISKL